MSLSAKVTAAVNKAFTAAGDLVQKGTLTSKSVSTYNFAARATVSTSTTKTVDVIIQTAQKVSGEGFITTAIMRSGEDLSVYDTLTVGTKIFSIIDYSDNNFIIEAQLSREVK
jgi:environmental stress-induced protein Ves